MKTTMVEVIGVEEAGKSDNGPSDPKSYARNMADANSANGSTSAAPLNTPGDGQPATPGASAPGASAPGGSNGLVKQNSFLSRLKFDEDGNGVKSAFSEDPPYVEWSIATVVKKSEDFHVVHPILEVPIKVDMSEYAYRKLMAMEAKQGGWYSPGQSMHGGPSEAGGSSQNRTEALELIEAIRQEASHHGGNNYSDALQESVHGGLGKAMDELMKSEKKIMEEKTRTVTSRFGLYCVFDGHNGPECGKFMRDRIGSTVSKYMKQHQQGVDGQEGCRPEDAIVYALKDTFVNLSNEFKASSQKGSGSTATVCHLEHWRLTVASVGDSRACIDTGKEVVMISTDHRVEDNGEECDRIKALGGVLGRVRGPNGESMGPLRVWPGGLAMSRSIGDADVGAAIISDPDILQLEVPEEGARVIIASDGLWDTCGAEQAARMVRHCPPKLAAEKLSQGALRSLGLRDDITVVVLDIIRNKDQPFWRAKESGGCGCFGGGPKEAPRPFAPTPAVQKVYGPPSTASGAYTVGGAEATVDVGVLSAGELDDGSAHFAVARRKETGDENQGLRVDLEEVGHFQTRRTSGAMPAMKTGNEVTLSANATTLGQLPGDASYKK